MEHTKTLNNNLLLLLTLAKVDLSWISESGI